MQLFIQNSVLYFLSAPRVITSFDLELAEHIDTKNNVLLIVGFHEMRCTLFSYTRIFKETKSRTYKHIPTHFIHRVSRLQFAKLIVILGYACTR